MRFSVGTLKGRAAIGTPGSIRKSYMFGEKRKDCYSCKTEMKAEIHNDKKKKKSPSRRRGRDKTLKEDENTCKTSRSGSKSFPPLGRWRWFPFDSDVISSILQTLVLRSGSRLERGRLS